MYSEDDFLPLSGLQHMAFCERRWALINIESIWQENRFTAEGKVLHERAHSEAAESRPDVLIRRSLRIHSLRLGLSGQSDIVEFQKVAGDQAGVSLERQKGLWRPYPIEYKRSRDKAGSVAYRVQLCAQALCLEEMLQTEIPEGAVYDHSTRRRQPIVFDPLLRRQVEDLAEHMHLLSITKTTPKAIYEKKCDSCSLYEVCLPKITGSASAQKYLKRAIAAAITAGNEEA
jgi:CRISPR-associated exonuclease Cas4